MKKRMLVLSGVVALVVAVGLIVVYQPDSRAELPEKKVEQSEAPRGDDGQTGGQTDPVANTVVLSGDRLKAAQLETVVVSRRRMADIRFVPGRIEYDDNRHVTVKAPTDGVLTRVLVKPGDRVEPGQVLAWLESSEIGKARAEMLLRKSENELAARTLQFKTSVNDNVQQAISALRARQDFKALQERFVGQVMGQYRESLLGAYSRLLLAEALLESGRPLGDSGGLSGRTIRERTNELRAAEAALNAVCEQAEFDTRSQLDKARLDADDAQRQMRISQQYLAALLMSPNSMPPGADATGGESPDDTSAGTRAELEVDEQRLSLVALRAPISGTVEDRLYSATERVRIADTLFVVADTGRLWVTADIRENEWAAIQMMPGSEITVTTPALPNQEFQARVYFVGREVSRGSNSIPLVAEIDNSEGLFRPGLFVRVGLPVDIKEDVVAVPLAAVVRHEGHSFVFVETQPGHFRRTDLQPGLESGDWVEVRQGLEPGERVVSKGAFLLKSELLLSGEEE
jgi:cobalt-zinc-cadmium efflux system membrane fusion protein